MSSQTRTTVISVRGRDRAALLADPSFCYVGRRCAGWPASPLGNPFRDGPDGNPVVDWARVDRGWWRSLRASGALPLTAAELFARWLESRPDLMARLPELRGKVLGCWCGDWRPGEPDIGCHAVTLARLVDGDDPR